MADDKPTSGNRWEPGLDDETAPIAGPAPAEGPTAAHEAVPTAEPPAALLVGGLGGFAVANAVDDEPGGARPGDAPGQGPQWDEHGDRHGGPGQGFGREGDAAGDSGPGGDGA